MLLMLNLELECAGQDTCNNTEFPHVKDFMKMLLLNLVHSFFKKSGDRRQRKRREDSTSSAR